MANYYDEALGALMQMKTAADELEAEIKRLELLIQQAVSANPLGNHQGTPDWVKCANARLLRDKHREWGRKIHGVVMGYAREMQSGWKGLQKGRTISFNLADVTVGTNEPYAKAIQHKHTVSPENSAVNEMIAKAANQLTGESGEKPLATQRKIIDVMINDPTNWWPFDQSDLSDLDPEVMLSEGVIPLERLKTRGAEQIFKQLTRYKKGSTGLDPATKGSLLDVSTLGGPLVVQPGPSGPRTTSLQTLTGQKLELLTIKMIYGQPRLFVDGMNKVRVSKIVFAAFRENGNLVVHYQQHS